MGLWYSKDSRFELIAYADADHAGCNDDCKSTSGGIQFLGDKLVSWSSKKQDCTTMSSVEAEYLADLFTKSLLKEMFEFLVHKIAAQLVPQYKPIGRCNNYAVLQSILCSPECKIVELILLDHLETPENPFVTPANIYTIEAFMNIVGYQGVVDKKFPNIPKRLEEEYHSIKDDVPLVSVYKPGNVLVRGMLIPDALLTTEIRQTDDFKEITPSAHRSPTVFVSPLVSRMRKRITGESSSPQQSLKITIKQKQEVEKDDDDSEDRIEPGSHKDNPKVVYNDDDK
ncbi:hypothetical protein Tco_1290566 [Tanacetum coccineum]